MKDRITVLFPVTDLARDGAQQQLLQLAREIDKSRFRPIVLSFSKGDAMEPDFRAVPGAELIVLERNSKYDFICLLKVARILRKMRVDVVQPFLTPATLLGILPALACRTPVKIVTERSGPGRRTATRGYHLYLKMEDFLSRFADWIVPNSRAGMDYVLLRGIDASRVKVIYNGIDFGRLASSDEAIKHIRETLDVPPGGGVVGMMARFYPVKNHALFLRAAALVSEKMPGTRFALVGDGPLRGELEALCRDLQLDSRTAFFGEQTDVADYVAAMDVLAHTSNTEGCSNSLLEAMSMGKPVVATNVGGNQEIIRNGSTGLLVAPGDEKAVAEAILGLLRDRQKAEEIGEKAKEYVVRQFSVQSMVRNYESLYEDTLRAKAKPKAQLASERRRSRQVLLLCTSPRLTDTATDRLSRLLAEPVDWDYLVYLASYHGVLPMLAHNLSNGSLSSKVPETRLAQLQEAYTRNLFRNMLLASETERAASRLSESGIRCVVLKGIPLAEALYGHPGLRPIADIDVLVHREDLPRASTSLSQLGYEADPVNGKADHPFHGVPYFKKGNPPIALELHWALDDPRLTSFDHRGIWSRASSMELGATAISTMSTEDNLLFLAYHLSKHDSEQLKFLCDVAQLVHSAGGQIDWDYIVRNARRWDIGPAAYYSLRRARDLLGAPVDSSALRQMRPGLIRRSLMDLLVDDDIFIAPPQSDAVRSETFALAHCLMMTRPSRMLAALSMHRGRTRRRSWPKTLLWIGVASCAALGRRLTKRRGLLHEAVSST